jgi:hypothetical protein
LFILLLNPLILHFKPLLLLRFFGQPLDQPPHLNPLVLWEVVHYRLLL